ncbi:preprotein translocase subunit SecE [Limibaculum sp. FT325]|uniref:preprotein translocase subunit SecE n=1 Tax=Thermohalobaculum sediminis TaxID=2939436 RepID=UPI0020C0F31D|nr:preprotein translocase subunit SecE [Limibaculum sediminis]MCL5775850.1 preprotein translocase subunit SecE [Limibaculum sediminis]
MMNPAQFVAQVRSEAAKVVWPSRKEAGLTTVMVFVMATLVAIFFFTVDQLLSLGVGLLLSL